MDEPIFIKGGLAVDERGVLRFVNDFTFGNVKRFYQVENHSRGFIRAWHGHEREGKYVWASSGSALVGVVSLNAPRGDISHVKKFVVSCQSPAILKIPNGYYNGFMTLEDDTRLLFFSTSTLDESKEDDIRLGYDIWNIWNENYR